MTYPPQGILDPILETATEDGLRSQESKVQQLSLQETGPRHVAGCSRTFFGTTTIDDTRQSSDDIILTRSDLRHSDSQSHYAALLPYLLSDYAGGQ